MFLAAIEKQQLRPLVNLLEEFGGWPVVEGDNWKFNLTWFDLILKFHNASYPYQHYLDFGVSVDKKNSTRQMLYVR